MASKPVMSVEDAAIYIQKSNPPIIVLSADGKVRTSGWTNPELNLRVYVDPPADGIQDVDFVAEEPTGITLDVILPISASVSIGPVDPQNYWGNGRSLAGFRIHAETNSLEASLRSAESVDVNKT